MKGSRLQHLIVISFSCLLVAGCSKKPEPAASTATGPVTNAPAATTAPATPSSAPGSYGADSTARLAGAEWALKQDAIKNDPDGQWAIQAKASSTYNDAQGTAQWSANQATGIPDVEKYADDGRAWTSKTPDSGIEWLELTYPKAVYATEVRIRESFGSGAVIKVELFDEQGAAHAVWAGNDPTTNLNYLLVKFEKSAYRTNRVKVTLATNVIPGWNEIDAAQLVGKEN